MSAPAQARAVHERKRTLPPYFLVFGLIKGSSCQSGLFVRSQQEVVDPHCIKLFRTTKPPTSTIKPRASRQYKQEQMSQFSAHVRPPFQTDVISEMPCHWPHTNTPPSQHTHDQPTTASATTRTKTRRTSKVAQSYLLDANARCTADPPLARYYSTASSGKLHPGEPHMEPTNGNIPRATPILPAR
jgi:hypothetical protein